ncbi:phage integrase family site-specific recombinase [Enterobacteriaceae bacterium ATCC 29904]|nr:phage integrase family site-specific recombinase [Enterobacteriaceae bacterium ATCC 29904]
MAERKLDSGKWICECYPAGRNGRRVRKQFATKGKKNRSIPISKELYEEIIALDGFRSLQIPISSFCV